MLRLKQRSVASEGVSQAGFGVKSVSGRRVRAKGLRWGWASCVQGTVGEIAKGEKRSNPEIRRQGHPNAGQANQLKRRVTCPPTLEETG